MAWHLPVPAHGRAPVQQALVDCVPIKHEPGLLPTSTFRSELLRLQAEAKAAGHPYDKNTTDQQCRRLIRQCYGQKCYNCEQTIDIHWGKEPINRLLDEDHTTLENRGSASFHKFCWKDYSHWKRNKRRRTKYEAGGGREQPAVEGGQPVIEGGQPAVEGGEPAIEGGQPAVEINPFMPPPPLLE